ncbi:MAG: hypothetical protein Kow00121_09250 [Elainellaceae cyanobacterium]
MHSIYFVLDHIRISGLDVWLENFVSGLKSYQTSEIQITQDPHNATIILFMGSGIARKSHFNPNHIKQHSLYKACPSRCFIWCTEDKPLDYLPGLYASLPNRFFNSNRHKAFIYYQIPTSNIPVSEQVNKDILYNFMGGMTSDVRHRLINVNHGSDTLVKERLNFNHGNPASDFDKKFFAEILQRSYFTLCPRGVGTSSYRIFEAMRFGSVPVFISDELVLPDGPDWSKCSVRIPEREIHSIRKILENQTEALQMGEQARYYYDLYFSEKNFLTNIVRLISTIAPSKDGLSNDLNFYRGQVEYFTSRIGKRISKMLK